jgi:hypothetical protein
MKRPSIDRIDSNGHYEINNCRFIELSENSLRTQLLKAKQVLQFTKDQMLLAEYISIEEAGRKTNISPRGISGCLNNPSHYHTAGGFIWKFKRDNNIK